MEQSFSVKEPVSENICIEKYFFEYMVLLNTNHFTAQPLLSGQQLNGYPY